MAYAGGVNWVATQKALQNFVVSVTGVAASHVVWGNQQAPRPAQAGIVMRLTVLDNNNRPWMDTEDNPFTFDDLTVVADDTADTLTATAHRLLTGDGPVRIASTGTIPAGLAADTDYWVVKVDADTIKLAASFLDAMNAVPVTIGLTDEGTGTITLSDTDDTLRAGEEIKFVQRSLIKCMLTLECYTDVGVGLDMATSILWRVEARRMLPTHVAILEAADISIIEVNQVRAFGGTQGNYLFEPRAMVDVSLYLVSEDTDNGGIIHRTEITREDDDGVPIDTFTVDAES